MKTGTVIRMTTARYLIFQLLVFLIALSTAIHNFPIVPGHFAQMGMIATMKTFALKAMSAMTVSAVVLFFVMTRWTALVSDLCNYSLINLVDTCDDAGLCSYAITDASCLITEICFSTGSTNSDSQCQVTHKKYAANTAGM